MSQEKNKILPSTLYLVGTPIGNLSDISERCKKTLSEVDFIACEDTRNSAKMLSLLEIHKELVSYHEHNKRSSGEKIIARLINGESCALITDAGMPAISDPGEDLVKLCAENNINVSVVPGPSAVVCAVALSGLATGRFIFEGFLPAKHGEKMKRIEELRSEERTMVFYEAPHRLVATLGDMREEFSGSRKISLCRELTKLNEEIIRTTIDGALAIYEKAEPRGEYVLVVSGTDNPYIWNDDNPMYSLSPEEHVAAYENLGLCRMDAIKAAARERGMSKSEFYKLLNS